MSPSPFPAIRPLCLGSAHQRALSRSALGGSLPEARALSPATMGAVMAGVSMEVAREYWDRSGSLRTQG